MGKGKKKKPISPKKSIQSLQESRDGGQIALRGYTYQFLYACYLMLTNQMRIQSFNLKASKMLTELKNKTAAKLHIFSSSTPSIGKTQAFWLMFCKIFLRHIFLIKTDILRWSMISQLQMEI